MSSDIAIAQFRFLERLLLVHGHWCYRRISTMVISYDIDKQSLLLDENSFVLKQQISKIPLPFFMQICYFFYKNITFGITVFLYEAYTSFSGQPAYNDWFLSLYNVLFTTLPVVALGVFDQDVSARFCLKVTNSHTPSLLYI